MDDVEVLFSKTIAEIEKLLNTKTVVGEPVSLNGSTVIPLVSIGFGFGVGAAARGSKDAGRRGGTGGGGGVKPVAIVVADSEGVRLDTLRGSPASSVIEKAIDTIRDVVRDRNERADPEPA